MSIWIHILDTMKIRIYAKISKTYKYLLKASCFSIFREIFLFLIFLRNIKLTGRIVCLFAHFMCQIGLDKLLQFKD